MTELSIATADVYQVERFLTYAVNYIGQTYLREQVDAYIYGKEEHFQTNLLNSLTNLCRQVHLHQETEILPLQVFSK